MSTYNSQSIERLQELINKLLAYHERTHRWTIDSLTWAEIEWLGRCQSPTWLHATAEACARQMTHDERNALLIASLLLETLIMRREMRLMVGASADVLARAIRDLKRRDDSVSGQDTKGQESP